MYERNNYTWTTEEDEELLRKFGKVSMQTLIKSLKRSKDAIIHRIYQLEGTYSYHALSGNLSVKDVTEIMGVGTTTVHRWIKSKKIYTVRPNVQYFIPEETFWKWLKNNLHRVNYKNIDDSIEFIVPNWYRDSIRINKRNYSKAVTGKQNQWTTYEVTTALDMYNKGYSFKEIASELDRTIRSVETKIYTLNKKKAS